MPQTPGMFDGLEKALAEVAFRKSEMESAKAKFDAASKAYNVAVAEASKLYTDLQNALAPIVSSPQNFRP